MRYRQNSDGEEDMLSMKTDSDYRRVIIDVGHNLSPDSELGDLAAAESAVNAKDVERRGVLGKLESEVRGKLKDAMIFETEQVETE